MKKGLKFLIGAVIVVAIGGAVAGGGTKGDTPSTNTVSVTAEKTTEAIEYISVSVDTLVESLSNNAAKAQKDYKGQYLEITGTVSVIDSDCKYISIRPSNNAFSLVSVQCYTKDQSQKDSVIELAKDQEITIKVKIKDVGEVLGYTADIIEFVK